MERQALTGTGTPGYDPFVAPRPSAAERLAAGDGDGALRIAVPGLEETGNKDALFATLEGLVLAGRKSGVADAAVALATALGAEGRWPMALAAASLAADAGTDPKVVLGKLAERYGEGAPRVSASLAVASPPAAGDAAPLSAGVKGGELYGRALQAATMAAAGLGTGDGAPVPRAPLLSRLAGDDFVALAAAFSRRWIADGAVLVAQGEEGDAVYVLADGQLRVSRTKEDEPGAVELARLGPGALVGEMAIVSRAPRSASVVASGPALVLEAGREALDAAAASHPAVADELVSHCRRRMAETLLTASPMLASVPSAERPLVLAALTPRPVAAGEVLVAQGQDADGLTLVVQGEVEVSRVDGDDKTVIARLGPGDVVGEISVVMRRPATASVVATTDCLTLHLPRDSFLPLAKAHPTLLAKLYELAVDREAETMSIVAADAVDADDLLI